MPYIKYEDWNPGPDAQRLVDRMNFYIGSYAAQGYALTLRQLFYRLVDAHDIDKTEKAYDRLGDVLGRARLAGLVDWAAIEDRGRSLEGGSVSTTDEKNIIGSTAGMFKVDRWQYQRNRVEVWVESKALADVVARPCDDLSVAHLAAGGYNSLTALWDAGQRFIGMAKEGYKPVLLYLGDHDPSGMDMSRNIEDRLREFGPHELVVRRIALNRDQVDRYALVSAPAKVTDSRFSWYREQYGEESWQLDALEPQDLDAMVRVAVQDYVDGEAWQRAVDEEVLGRRNFELLAEHWDLVKEYLRMNEDKDEGAILL